MFIVIKKIITEFKKDSERNTVKHPTTNKPLVDGYKIVSETIRIDQIKSAREFHFPNKYTNSDVKGEDVSVLYMIGGKGEGKDPTIHIKENIAQFNERLGARDTKD